ncbi:MAG: flagellar biosynthesis protein FlgJ [Alphaproteobacteria bacterium]|nr:MAG: flagellar biosynthesis protein FlgJ [Alphaproteobacteria bacterium]
MSIGMTSSISGASQEVLNAIKNASSKTGVSFDYLVNQARAESSFRTDAKAKTSSATGLYQFIDQTWLGTVKQHGSKHGLSDAASKIQKDFQGRFFVANDADKASILDLRKNPRIASLMAAEFASGNQKYLESKIDRDANSTDLYFAHFLGAGGASKFLSAMEDDPDQAAAPLLKSAANANKNIFYNSNGSQKSLNQIYKNFEAKFSNVTKGQGIVPDTEMVADVAVSSYRVDPQFSNFYSSPVDEFVGALPSMPSLKNDALFSSLFGNSDITRMQNQIIDPVSFLMFTQLDVPK